MKLFIFFYISMLFFGLSIQGMNLKEKEAKEIKNNETVQVKKLPELLTHHDHVPKGTQVICGEGELEEHYITESDETTYHARWVTISRNQDACCGKTTQKMIATLMKPLHNPLNSGQVNISRKIKTTACGKVIQVGVYTTGVVLSVSALAGAYLAVASLI
jgi:hypothetical protein